MRSMSCPIAVRTACAELWWVAQTPQAQAQLATRMGFRPSSVKSTAHKRLAAVMDRCKCNSEG